jgi:hypothetical protein
LPDTRAGHLRTNEELREGIKTFQLYAGIPVTGVVDEKTMRMMALPRCGMPDFGRSDRTKRRRRYAVQGTVWWEKVGLHLEMQVDLSETDMSRCLPVCPPARPSVRQSVRLSLNF